MSCLSTVTCPAWQLQYGSRQPAGLQSTGFGYPRALTYETDRDLIWVGDNNNAVLAFRPDGTFVHRFGSQGKAIGQFSGGVQGIQVVGNKVYTTDTGNCRLSIWDEDALLQAQQYSSPTGMPLTTMGTCGTGPNQMVQPRGIAVGDATGDINTVYVAETAGEPDLGVGRRGQDLGRPQRRRARGTAAAGRGGSPGTVPDLAVRRGRGQPADRPDEPGRRDLPGGHPRASTCRRASSRGADYVEFDAQGRMYASDNNRRIYRFVLNG